MNVLEKVGIHKDAETIENESGGKQSALEARFDLLPPRAIITVSSILDEGAKKYGEWNWLSISTNDNINHALAHIFAHFYGDSSEDHLGHATTRLLFALELEERRKENLSNNFIKFKEDRRRFENLLTNPAFRDKIIRTSK